ncbi:MAG: hypothetical protein AAF842_06335 [Planctomycetota bacterium]
MTRSAGTTRRRTVTFGGGTLVVLAAFVGVDLIRQAIQPAITSPEARRQALLDDINAAITSGVAFLESRQSADGAWRSQTYGFMKDGITLTPHVLSATTALPESMASASTARGVDYLLGIDPTTAVLLQPVYTAAETSWVLRLAGHEQAADPWLDLIESHQLTEQLGWPRTDARYGGWSYATSPPTYDTDAVDLIRPDANMSATVFGVGALKLAGRLSPVRAEAAIAFVELIQSGGMWFSPLDDARNKAGWVPSGLPDPVPLISPAVRRVRSDGERLGNFGFYHNVYGSPTADGVRTLLACGLPLDDTRVRAAGDWLIEHFRADTVPGDFADGRERLRHGYYHYYAWSVSHALRRLGVTHAGADRQTPWADQLALALIASQRVDGSWRNASTDGKEDDPLVATPFALSALAVCRNALMEVPAE